MAQSVKELLIRLNGEVSSSASKVGDWLEGLGSTLDRIGQYTREFEKESASIYRNYEDNMLAAKFAMSAQVDSATELEKQMAGLDEMARKWASTTIFHTDDVSQAINEAAHAGWNYQQMLEGIPEAMLIAQAGGMDLSAGLDYLVKMVNATRTPMDEMGKVVDQWAMAANISATNIDELGQAFISMGAAAQFGDSTEELFAMLAAMANVGTTGTKAGTALRNTIMRLIAPTTKAEAAMDLLGADVEELQEVLSDENVTKAAKTLEGLGFSAFDDDTGKLKPIKDIFEELFTLTEGMDEASKDELLAAIFPTRTIATALSLLTASNGELDEMYKKIRDSEGYAGQGAEIMMSGLTGSIETLKSKWEEFKRAIGETLAPHIEKIAEFLGNFVDGLNNMPPEVLEGLTNMLSTLSVAGPILMSVGAISKLVGFLGPFGTLALAAGVGVSFLWGYLTKLDQLDFESKFGTLGVDVDELGTYVDTIQTKFDAEQKTISRWTQAVEEAQRNYNNALTGMNEGLLKKILTGGTFTDDDFSQFDTLGQEIVNHTLSGIQSAEARDMSFLQAIFGDKSTPEEIAGYENVAGVMDYYYQGLYGEAEKIGANIRAKLTEALHKKELTPEDREAIQAQIDRLNEINAEISAGMQQQAYYAQLEKASRVSLDTVESFMSDNAKKLEAAKAAVNDQYDASWGYIKAAFEYARAEGKDTVTFTDSTGETRTVNVSKEAEEEIHRLHNEEREKSLKGEDVKFGNVSATAFDTLMRDNEWSEAWNLLKEYYSAGGAIPFESFLGSLPQEQAAKVREQLEEMEGRVGKLKGYMSPFASNDEIYAMMRALEMISEDRLVTRAGSFMDIWTQDMINRGVGGWMQGGGFYYNDAIQEKQTELANERDKLAELEAKQEQYFGEIKTQEKWLKGEGRPFLWNEGATMDALYGAGGKGGGLYDNLDQVTFAIDETEAKIAALEEELAAMENEKEIYLTVDDKEVQDYKAPPKYGNVFYVPAGAEESEEVPGGNHAYGGRAVIPSIFGEAGPEWAIPEEHTERTAQLLDAARRASGFTWGDLISRYGGLNANPKNNPVVLNYSPVINAGDAKGVAGALAEDKDKLIRMVRQAIDEARFKESVEVYA